MNQKVLKSKGVDTTTIQSRIPRVICLQHIILIRQNFNWLVESTFEGLS